MLPCKNVNHHSSQSIGVKHEIVEVREETAQVKKLITSLEAKLDAVLAKKSEK